MAETCFDTLSNDDFLSEFHDKMSKTEEGRTFLQKMARFFADLAKQLKKAVQGYAARTNNEMVRELMNDAEMLEHINTRFRELLEGAEKVTLPGTTDGNTIKFSRMNNNSFAENVNDILTMSDEEALQNKAEGNFVSILRHTPEVILENVKGAEDHEIIISFHSLYLETRSSGVLEGNYHSLGKDIVAALPRYLSDPDAIVRMKSGRLNLFATITEGKKKNRVISVEMNTVKDINSKNEKYHLVITMFPAGNNYIKNDIARNGDYIEYEKEGLAQVNPQLRASLATINAKPSGTIIPDSEEKINTSGENNGAGDVRGQRSLDSDSEGEYTYNGLTNKDFYRDSRIYTYDFLIHQDDMKILEIPEHRDIFSSGRIERDLIVDTGKKNALSVEESQSGTNDEVFIKNIYTKRQIEINNHSIRHGLGGKANYLFNNARAGMIAGEIIRHAIPINELITTSNASGTYAMISYAESKSGQAFIVISHIDVNEGRLDRIDALDITHSLKARYIGDALSGTKKGSTAAEFTAPSTEENPVPIVASTISISDLLEIVKEVQPDILSKDVQKHLGTENPTKGYYVGQTLHQRSLDTAEEADARALMEENEALRAQVEMLQAEFKLTRDFMGTRAIKHHLRELAKEYGAKSSGKLFDKLYELVQSITKAMVDIKENPRSSLMRKAPMRRPKRGLRKIPSILYPIPRKKATPKTNSIKIRRGLLPSALTGSPPPSEREAD